MLKLLIWVAVIVSLLSLVASVKEWKNFENGKVYSRKMTNENKEVESQTSYERPVVEERLLHSHHKDKNRKVNPQQTVDPKSMKTKNAERHHRKSVEEEIHLRPLNERHHKFPNPALLDKTDGLNSPNAKVSRHTFLQEVRRKQNRRRSRGGNRLKRNRSDHKDSEQAAQSEIKPDKKIESKIEESPQDVKKPITNKIVKNEPVPYSQIRKDGFPVKQTSYW